MKQIISDGSTAKAATPAHLPAQISVLLPTTLKVNNNFKSTEENGGYVNSSAVTTEHHFEDNNSFGNLSPDLSHRRNLSLPSSGDSRTTSMNSIDFAEMINRQQQSLAAIAYQHQTPAQSPNENSSPEAEESHNHFPILTNGHRNGSLVPIESARNGSLKKRNNSDLSSHLIANTKTIPAMVNLKGETVVPMNALIVNGSANGDESNLNDSTKKIESAIDVNKWDGLRRLLSGVALTLLSAFFFSVTTVIVKFVTDIKPSQMALFRYLGKFVINIFFETNFDFFRHHHSLLSSGARVKRALVRREQLVVASVDASARCFRLHKSLFPLLCRNLHFPR